MEQKLKSGKNKNKKGKNDTIDASPLSSSTNALLSLPATNLPFPQILPTNHSLPSPQLTLCRYTWVTSIFVSINFFITPLFFGSLP